MNWIDMTGSGKRIHILRPSLPWREVSQLTECGHESSNAIARSEFLAGLKENGPQRMAVLCCMTCFSTAHRHADWDTDPRSALLREIIWESAGRDRGHALRDDLTAIAALIAAHRDEFDELVRNEIVRREWKARKAK